MHEVRKIKTQDEITLLNTACMMVDSAYDELYRFMKPGVKENDASASSVKSFTILDPSMSRASTRFPANAAAPIRMSTPIECCGPGDPAFFDILHSYNGYRTCYYRTFAVGSASPAMVDAYKRCRDYMDAAISIVKPGVTTATSSNSGQRPRSSVCQ